MPPRSKPAALTIVAILNLVVGLPCMCCMGLNAGVLAATGGAANQPKAAANDPLGQAMEKMNEQVDFFSKEVPSYKVEQIAYNVVAVLCSIVLVISAIGLFMGRAWGRIGTIAASAVMIIAVLGNTVYTVAAVLPAAKKFEQQQVGQQAGPPPPKGAQEVSGFIGVCFALLIGAGYPAAAIAMLMTGPVRQYFAEGASRRDDGYDDRRDDLDRRDDDYDRRRDDDYYDRRDDDAR
jgi:hypothetical protein